MEKIKQSIGKISTICVITGCLYGVANFLSGKFYLPGCSFAELRPQVILPMFIGIMFGPVAGFVCGGLGDMFGYYIGGKGLLFAPYWSLANGLMGLIPGMARYLGARTIDSIGSFVKLLGLLLLASSLPFAFATAFEFRLGHLPFHDAVFRFFLPIVITDTLWAFTLVPLFMYVFRLLIVRIEMRTILTVYYLLILTVMATWLSDLVITGGRETQVEVFYTLGAVTLLVLIVGLAVSVVSSKKITAPVINLTAVARRVEDGDYSRTEELRGIINRPDELGTLAKVFSGMIQSVKKREHDLRHQLTTLEIEIDRKKQSAELEKITGSDYFKKLKQKAAHLRRQATDGEEKDSA
ncbi:MAG: HAMP domain-containing protein [PVC group bacterium]